MGRDCVHQNFSQAIILQMASVIALNKCSEEELYLASVLIFKD